eukprot:PhM_4_TR9553/c0_g1_i1/m.15449
MRDESSAWALRSACTFFEGRGRLFGVGAPPRAPPPGDAFVARDTAVLASRSWDSESVILPVRYFISWRSSLISRTSNAFSVVLRWLSCKRYSSLRLFCFVMDAIWASMWSRCRSNSPVWSLCIDAASSHEYLALNFIMMSLRRNKMSVTSSSRDSSMSSRSIVTIMRSLSDRTLFCSSISCKMTRSLSSFEAFACSSVTRSFVTRSNSRFISSTRVSSTRICSSFGATSFLSSFSLNVRTYRSFSSSAVCFFNWLIFFSLAAMVSLRTLISLRHVSLSFFRLSMRSSLSRKSFSSLSTASRSRLSSSSSFSHACRNPSVFTLKSA